MEPQQQPAPKQEQSQAPQTHAAPASHVPPVTTMPNAAPQKDHALLGPIIAGLIVVLVLALGALYLWGAALIERVTGTTAPAPVMVEETPAAAELETIEDDLENDFASLDQEFADIDAALSGDATASTATETQ